MRQGSRKIPSELKHRKFLYHWDSNLCLLPLEAVSQPVGHYRKVFERNELSGVYTIDVGRTPIAEPSVVVTCIQCAFKYDI